jgi:hypothetical protein
MTNNDIAKVEQNNNTTNRTCFFITPIGEVNSMERRKTEGLLDQILRPILEEMKFIVFCSYIEDESGSISNRIFKRLFESDLVIANLTGLNPNVMYELAVRHAVRKPTICMAECGTDLPFDIKDQRTLFYHDAIYGANELKENLKRMINSSIELKSEDIDNPIYNYCNQSNILQRINESDPIIVILKEIDAIKTALHRMNNQGDDTIYTYPTLSSAMAISKFSADLRRSHHVSAQDYIKG